MVEYFPVQDVPGLDTIDHIKVPVLTPGYYTTKFGNEKAWFKSVDVKWKAVFTDSNGQTVDVTRVQPNK